MMKWKNDEKWRNRVIKKSVIMIDSLKKREIVFILSMEMIARENHNQILIQTLFCILVLGRVMLDSLRSQYST